MSERTVSRYLRGRPTTRSQTWRTFLANTFGTQTFISPMMFEDADDEETRVDASDEAPRPAQSIDMSRQSIHGRTRDLAHSRRPSTIGIGLAQRHPRTGARMSNCRDPPRDLHRGQPRGVCIGLSCLMRINLTSHRNRRQCEEISRTHARLLQLQLPLDEQSCRQRLRTPDTFVQSATGCLRDLHDLILANHSHAAVNTTLNIYTQGLDGSVRAAVEAVGGELFTIVH